MQQAPAKRPRRMARPFYLCEPLENRLLLSVIAINGTTSQDTIVISAHLRLGIQWVLDYTIDGGTTQHATLSTVDTIAVDTVANTDGSGDTIDILASPPNPMAITGHSGYDSLNLGQAGNGVQSVLGPITMFSSMNITLDDSADAAAPRQVSLSASSLSGLLPGGITWGALLHSITIKTGSFGGSTVNLSPGNNYFFPISVIGDSQGADDTLNIYGVSTDPEGPPAHTWIDLAAPTPVGRWDLNVDDSMSSVGGIGSSSLQINELIDYVSAIEWATGAVRSLSIETPQLGKLIIGSTDIPTSITGANTSSVIVNVQQITGPLTVHGDVSFDDGSDLFARNLQFSRAANGTDTRVDGLAPTILTYGGDASFDLSQKVDGGIVDILATGPGVTAIVAPRAVTVNVGNSSSPPDIQGVLQLDGVGGRFSVQIDDSADATARNITVGTAQSPYTGAMMGEIHGLLSGDIYFNPSDIVGPLVIDGGAGANTFTINTAAQESDAAGVGLLLNTGAGDDAVDIRTNPVTVDGGSGNDAVTVDLTGIPELLGVYRPGAVALNGGSGTNSLTIIQSPTAPPASVLGSSIISSYQITSFSHVSTLVLSGGPFTLSADMNGLNLSLAGTFASVARTQHLAALTLDATAQATLEASTVPWAETIFCTALSIASGGKLNLTNNALQLTYGTDPIASIRSYLTSGYAGGAWTGPGIDSSSAAQNASHATAIGYADSADGLVAGLPANTIELKYTAYGDANLDGMVSLPDLLTQVRHFGQPGSWDAGDFNFDNTVGLPDFLILVGHFGVSAQNAMIASALAAWQPQAPVAFMPLVRHRTRSVLAG